ncbi:unnamed protein product, partial [Natator depressus]
CHMDIFQQTTFSGIDLTSVFTPDSFVCRTICTYYPNCLFFTFFTREWKVETQRKLCFLKTSGNGVPHGRVERENVICGFSLLNCRRSFP